MAVRILTTDGSWTTGTWYRAEAYSTDYYTSTIGGNGTSDLLSTPRALAVTFANAGNQVGIFLPLRTDPEASGWSVTVKLQQNVASVWTDRTTDTFSNPTYFSQIGVNLYYLPLTSYAVTTASSTWRYVVSTTATYTQWLRSSTAGDYGYAVALDNSTAKPSSGDLVIIADGKVYTLDADQYWNIQDANMCGIICDNAVIRRTSAVTSPHTWTIRTWINCGYRGGIEIGTESDPIPRSARLTIDRSGSNLSAIIACTTHSAVPVNSLSEFYISMYGEETEYIGARIASNALAGQDIITTVENMSSVWSIGDTIKVVGKEVGAIDAVEYTILSIVGTTIQLSANLDYKAFANGAIINKTIAENTLGIKVLGKTTTTRFLGQAYYKYVNMAGVYLYDCELYVNKSVGNSAGDVYRNLFFEASAAANGLRLHNGPSDPTIVGTVHGIYGYGNAVTGSNGCTLSQSYINADKIYITNYRQSTGTLAPIVVTGQGCNISNVVCFSSYTSSSTFGAISLPGAIGCTLTDICSFSTSPVYISSSYNCEIYGLRTYNATFASMTCDGSIIKFYNSDIGYTSSFATGLEIYSSGYTQIIFENTYIGSRGISDISREGAFYKYHNYANVTGDHRVIYRNGLTQSTGDGLSDTTVHTAGSGKFALRFEMVRKPTSGNTTPFDYSFEIPTGNIQNKSMTVGVWCKINSANYYSGTFQLPRLTISYDDGASTAYAQASTSTDWQLIFITFTPTTTFGKLSADLSTYTDQISLDSYVYWDDFLVLYPSNTTLDLGGLDLWSNALPITPPIASPISAYTVSAAVWEELKSSHTTAGTMGKALQNTEQLADDNQALILCK